MKKILAVEWRSSGLLVGFVAIETDIGNWKAYVGPGMGNAPGDDARFIAMCGAKLMEHEARAFFPQFAAKAYEQPDGSVQTSAEPATVESMRAALGMALQLIRAWHGVGLGRDNEQAAWDLYLKNAPELKPILTALAAPVSK